VDPTCFFFLFFFFFFSLSLSVALSPLPPPPPPPPRGLAIANSRLKPVRWVGCCSSKAKITVQWYERVLGNGNGNGELLDFLRGVVETNLANSTKPASRTSTLRTPLMRRHRHVKIRTARRARRILQISYPKRSTLLVVILEDEHLAASWSIVTSIQRGMCLGVF